jgi:hypothetical protein
MRISEVLRAFEVENSSQARVMLPEGVSDSIRD